MQAHTVTDTDMLTYRRSQTDKQTDRQTDGQTHTHTYRTISLNHLPQLKWVSTELCVWRHQILHEGDSKRRQEIKVVRNNFIPTCNCQCSKQHPCMSIFTIPKIKAQLPTSYNGRHTDINLSVCMVIIHSPSPNYQSSHPHVFKYLSLLTVSSSWTLDLPLCAPGREGR